MRLLIDAGNTRIKWALADDSDWLRGGVLPVVQARELPALFPESQQIRQIWVSNVAGDEVAHHIRAVAAGTSAQLHFAVAQERQCGVHNSYSNPSQLGSDRWASLIAAWHLVQGKCLVVNSGTATTIDTLSGQGEFLGGLILPGVELMQHSVVAAAAQLKSAQGKYVPLPLNSADALYSGAIQASCGAMELQYALFEDTDALVLLSGGAAELLQQSLKQRNSIMPTRFVDNLVLQGLLLMADEAGA